MLHEVTGDILHSKAAVIVHGVAPNDPFHSGLALQLRQLFPRMYRDFRHYCQSTHAKPGSLWAWSGANREGSVQIMALLTQEGGYQHGDNPGKATVANVNHALRALRAWIESERPRSLALPRLATGVGGLDWNDVRPLVVQHLADAGVPVFLYTTYRSDVPAPEPATAVKAGDADFAR